MPGRDYDNNDNDISENRTQTGETKIPVRATQITVRERESKRVAYTRCEDDGLEALEDGPAGDGGVHAAKVEDGVMDGRSTLVKRLNNEAET